MKTTMTNMVIKSIMMSTMKIKEMEHIMAVNRKELTGERMVKNGFKIKEIKKSTD